MKKQQFGGPNCPRISTQRSVPEADHSSHLTSRLRMHKAMPLFVVEVKLYLTIFNPSI
jgi:hypothetical protein